MKDPAFLFYFRDFKVSTETMTNASRGAYIMLMCEQADKGFITKEDAMKACSTINFETMKIDLDKRTLEEVLKKFEPDPENPGCFFNSRLRTEVEKRKKYAESRRKNRKKRTHDETYVKTYDKEDEKHMSPHMVNENENGNIDINEMQIEGVPGETKRTFEEEAMQHLVRNYYYIPDQEDFQRLKEINVKIQYLLKVAKKDFLDQNVQFDTFRSIIENLDDFVKTKKFSLKYILNNFNEVWTSSLNQKEKQTASSASSKSRKKAIETAAR